MSTPKLIGRIIEHLNPGHAVVELSNEPGTKWVMMKKGHLTLLRRHDEYNRTTKSTEEVRRALQGELRQDIDG